MFAYVFEYGEETDWSANKRNLEDATIENVQSRSGALQYSTTQEESHLKQERVSQQYGCNNTADETPGMKLPRKDVHSRKFDLACYDSLPVVAPTLI